MGYLLTLITITSLCLSGAAYSHFALDWKAASAAFILLTLIFSHALVRELRYVYTEQLAEPEHLNHE